MPFSLSRRMPLPTRFRRFVGRVLAIVYSATALGLPIPQLNAEGIGATAYPCQGKGCGCRTAEQCWKTCCCHSAAERVTWARERGIRVPQELVAWAARESTVASARGCCAAKRSCCESRSPVAARSLSMPVAKSEKPLSKAKRPSGIAWVSPLAANGCRGAAAAWINGPLSLPAVSLKPLVRFDLRVQPLSSATAIVPPCPSFSPAEPPPRDV